MPTQTLSPKRILLKRAILCSLAMTVVVMASLFGAASFKAQETNGSRAHAAKSTEPGDLAIESLSNKIASDNQARQKLMYRRAALEEDVKQEPAFVLTPTERSRRKLVSQLIHLLALEKQSPEGSPEITQTREQIDTLQAQIADMPSVDGRSQGVVAAAKSPSETELEAVDQQIATMDAATKADVAQLGQLVRAKEVSESLLHVHVPKDSNTLLIVLVSVFFGIALGLAMILLAHHYSVQDENGLRKLLPPTVQLIGSVPHMRALP